MTRKRRNKIMKLAKGYWGSKSKHFRVANQAVMKSLSYAYTALGVLLGQNVAFKGFGAFDLAGLGEVESLFCAAIRMSPGIDIGDFNTKLRNAQKFIADGNLRRISLSPILSFSSCTCLLMVKAPPS